MKLKLMNDFLKAFPPARPDKESQNKQQHQSH